MTYSYEYERAGLTCDVVLFYVPSELLLGEKLYKKDFEVLVIKRNIEPFKNHWALPGGYMEIDETLEDAAMREVKEEVGIDIDNLIPIGIYDALARNVNRVISVAFLGILTQKIEPIVNDPEEIKTVKWQNLADIGKAKLAFDHKDMVSEGYYKIVTQRKEVR